MFTSVRQHRISQTKQFFMIIILFLLNSLNLMILILNVTFYLVTDGSGSDICFFYEMRLYLERVFFFFYVSRTVTYKVINGFI